MKPLYECQSLCFSCTGCGDCCSTGNDYYVYLAGREADRIRRAVNACLAREETNQG